MAGRIRYFSWVKTGEPGGQVAVTGSTFSQMAKMTMSTTPETNSGTVENDKPAHADDAVDPPARS